MAVSYIKTKQAAIKHEKKCKSRTPTPGPSGEYCKPIIYYDINSSIESTASSCGTFWSVMSLVPISTSIPIGPKVC